MEHVHGVEHVHGLQLRKETVWKQELAVPYHFELRSLCFKRHRLCCPSILRYRGNREQQAVLLGFFYLYNMADPIFIFEGTKNIHIKLDKTVKLIPADPGNSYLAMESF